MLLPGNLIAIITFPGLIIKSFTLAVFGLKPDSIESYKNFFLLISLPFFINSLITMAGGIIVLSFIATIPDSNTILEGLIVLFATWIFISIGMHALPSTGDAKKLWDLSKQRSKEGSAMAILGFPIAAFLMVISFLKIVWIDLLYTLLIFFLPYKLLFP